MLTYESIRQVVNKEKKDIKLTQLPQEFFNQARAYLEKKRRMKNREDAWELTAAKRILQDLVEIRERKIVTLALYSVRTGEKPENLTPEETSLLESVSGIIKDWQAKKKSLLKAKDEPKTLVAAVEAVPQFMGTDMRTYGPFEPGDMATVPSDAAKLLIDSGIARQLKI
jgi:DNA replication initiation complex subunit (GINS family)